MRACVRFISFLLFLFIIFIYSYLVFLFFIIHILFGIHYFTLTQILMPKMDPFNNMP